MFKLRLLIHLRFKAYSSAVAWKIEEKVFRSKVSPQSLQDTPKKIFSILTFTSSFLLVLSLENVQTEPISRLSSIPSKSYHVSLYVPNAA